MENRFQHVLLSCVLACSATTLSLSATAASNSIDAEYFDFGVNVGTVDIEDFGSEIAFGLNANFKASENFFLQFNYFAAEVGETELESQFTAGDASFRNDDRDFTHVNFLLGYNIFHGEFFPSRGKADLSSLYLVGGVGETEFGGDARFTTVFGVGYQVGVFNNYILRVDYKNLIYKSSLVGTQDNTTNNSTISFGINYQF